MRRLADQTGHKVKRVTKIALRTMTDFRLAFSAVAQVTQFYIPALITID
jgi:hypothetical protein